MRGESVGEEKQGNLRVRIKRLCLHRRGAGIRECKKRALYTPGQPIRVIYATEPPIGGADFLLSCL